jgi:hypothetical protein
MKMAFVISVLLVLAVLPAGITRAAPTPLTTADAVSDVVIAEPVDEVFKPVDILDILYGKGNLVRIDDIGAEVTDQYWAFTSSLGIGTATATAKYSNYVHQFGILPDVSGDTFESLFSSGSAYHGIYKAKDAPTGPFSDDEGVSVFRLGLELVSEPGWRWSSAIADNKVMPGGVSGDGADHMATWKIVSSDTKHKNTIGNYVIGWDDTSGDKGDFLDLVVELSGIAPTKIFASIPEPATFVLLVLGGVIWQLRRHKT